MEKSDFIPTQLELVEDENTTASVKNDKEGAGPEKPVAELLKKKEGETDCGCST